MINIGSSIFECETLFLQPTWSCAKNCIGCYVKEKESKFGSEEIDFRIWLELLSRIDTDNNIKANQITLALDTLPKDQWSDSYSKMYDIAQLYKSIIRNRYGENVKYHLTVNAVSDLEQYTQSELYEGLDLISVSNINNLDDIKLIKQCAPHTKINWNVLASTLVKKPVDQIKEILTHVNQCYLLLPKAPLGLDGHDFSSFLHAVGIMVRDLKAVTPESDSTWCAVPGLGDKIHIDRCMIDGLEYGKEGTGCASNISRFQIWPDGRVTGCAYNSHNQYGKKAESFQDILDNLFDARTRYEFNSCTIPKFGLNNIRVNQ